MKKFVIKTLGCKVNQYDSLNLKKKLIEAGFEYSKSGGEDVELAIVNSCAVTKHSIAKGRRMFTAIQRENPNAKAVLLGCWAKIYPEEMQEAKADLIWEVGSHGNLVKEIKKLFEGKNEDFLNQKNNELSTMEISSPGEGERSRYFLKIQDGCEQFCSYCIIPYARGKLFSRPRKEILAEIKLAVEAGYREIILCGIHLGLYGKEKERKEKLDLKDLLTEIIKIKDLGRVRLSSIEINDVNDELLKLMAESDKICQHLHIPLQAGSDKILKAMNRPYTKAYFEKRVKKSRELMKKIAITTDVIVGFPGETTRDFKETAQFCEEMEFSGIHVFPFSLHEKTPAVKIENQLDEKVKKERAAILRKVGKKLSKKYQEKFRGKELKVVIQKVLETEVRGKSEFYFDVKGKKEEFKEEKCSLRVGKIIKIRTS